MVLVTGGTSGIGRELVAMLCGAGATTLFTARNPSKGRATMASIQAETGPADLHCIPMDLGDLASVVEAAGQVVDQWPRLDLLICNAGHQSHQGRTETQDGFESTFGINHVGHAALVRRLEDRLRQSAPSRVVVVASGAHRRAVGGLDFSDLMMSRGRFRPKLAYNRSKLANILYTGALARSLAGSGVDANSAHPGGVDTPMMRANVPGRPGGIIFDAASSRLLLSPGAAAASLMRVAVDPALQGTSGRYFSRGVLTRPGRAARDDRAGARLWSWTEATLSLC